MKSFRFENIWLFSRADRRASQFKLHPGKNLILGRNHTGKSSLIRALFETMGATPQGRLEGWDPNTACVVQFRVDDRVFRAAHQRGHRAMFSEGGDLLSATGSYDGWSKQFSEVTGFNLSFSDKDMHVVPADPSCFFLPFYINQDGSWQADWNTFRGMRRFRAPWSAILEYFSGIAPPEYYRLKANRDEAARKLDELNGERRLLARTRDRFSQSVALSGPKIDPSNFEREIARLTVEVTALNEQQEKLRERAVQERELLASLRDQIRLSADALKNYESDSAFLRQERSEHLVCPVCHAEHTRSFFELLTFADDARVLRELILRLRDDVEKVQIKHASTRAAVSQLDDRYRTISGILQVRRGEMQFKQVVDSIGAENAFSAFEQELTQLESAIAQSSKAIANLDGALKQLRNKKRSEAILKAFRERYVSARQALNLPPVDSSRIRLNSRPDLSGSGGPRALLAYYAALWHVCHAPDGAYSVSVVIDSPNQQAQDDINLPAVLRFIAEKLPQDMQLVVALETRADFGFDNTIELVRPYRLLSDEEYESVSTFVQPHLTSMFNALAEGDGALDLPA